MSVEEHEEIPWSMLVANDRRARSRTLYVAAVIIVAAVVGFAGIRSINGQRSGIAPAELTAIQVTTTAAPPPTTTTLLSEADLMAIDPATAQLAAVARAEWFVTDYFTIDGSPAPEFLSAFPDDAVLPELPRGSNDVVSFVEWARAYRVRSHPKGLVVTVLFRTLYENPEQRYERSPVRAVDVIVLIEDQATAVADLPIPVQPPVTHGISGWMSPGSDAPADAIARSLDYAGRFSENPAIVESGASGLDWRVVFTVDDPSGARFPMVLRSDVLP